MLIIYRLALTLLVWDWFKSLDPAWPLTPDEAWLSDLFALAFFFWACRPLAQLLAKTLTWIVAPLVAYFRRRASERRDPWRGTRIPPGRLPG